MSAVGKDAQSKHNGAYGVVVADHGDSVDVQWLRGGTTTEYKSDVSIYGSTNVADQLRKQGKMAAMDLVDVNVSSDGDVNVKSDPSGDEARAGEMSLYATSAKCPYCTKTVAMSGATLDHHRALSGTCPGAGRSVARVEMGRAVLMARPKTETCPFCEAWFPIDASGKFPQHRGIRGGTCPGAGKTLPEAERALAES